jgi:uncharacterized protein YggE
MPYTPYDVYVGTTHSTLRHGKVTVIEYRNSYDIAVRFHDTGHTTSVQAGQLRLGTVRDHSKMTDYSIGATYPTNNYGVVTIVKYEGSRDVTIRFNDTGATSVVALSNLKTGQVRDPSVKPPKRKSYRQPAPQLREKRLKN